MYELKDLCPSKSEITLKSTGKTYILRPITLEDQIWGEETFGKPIHEIFNGKSEIPMSTVARLIFHQLNDKKDFEIKEIDEIDEEGNNKKVKIGGWKALCHNIQIDEINALIRAYLKNWGLSQPIENSKAIKKNLQEQAKKLTGDTSSTNLPASMDGVLIKSEK